MRNWMSNKGAFVAMAALFVVVVALVMMCLAMAGCTRSAQSAGGGDHGGVAAEVNGDPIMEEDVTRVIQVKREYLGLDDKQWKEWLEAFGRTPEVIRQEAIEQLAWDVLVRQAAAEKGVTVTNDQVVAAVNQQREVHGESDFADMLKSLDMDEKMYRDYTETQLLSEQLRPIVKAELEAKGSLSQQPNSDFYIDWLEQRYDSATIEINDMPASLPYAV